MLFVLQEIAHGDPLGEFDSREAAEAALDRLVAAEPAAAEDIAIVAYDAAGNRIGEPITRRVA